MLTTDQLMIIDQHLRTHLQKRKWFQQETFIAEITDHYVNAISESMNRGVSFHEALTSAYNSFGQSNGLQQLELTYWKFSAQQLQERVTHNVLECFKFPLVLITIALITIFLLVRIHFTWVFSAPFGSLPYAFFHYSLYSTAILSLLDMLFKKYVSDTGRFRPSALQRIATLIRIVSNWSLLLFCLEMFSSPIFIGSASPYIATLLYTVTALVYFGYNRAMKSYLFSAHIGK